MSGKEFHHLVPACYLAYFGISGNEGRDSKIYFLNVSDNKSGTRKVDKIAGENGFNDFVELDENKRLIEDLFANVIEPKLSQLLKRILSVTEIDPSARKQAKVQLSIQEKNELSAQMAFQYVRTRVFRDKFKSLYGQLKEGFPYADLPKYAEPDFKRIHFMEFFNPKFSNFLANLFDDRHWVFLVNHTGKPFITSDAPVIQINHKTKKGEALSPVSPRATMFFPLSPTIAIEVYDKSIAKEDMCYFDIYLPQVVDWYNYNEIANCSRVVLSNVSFDVLKYTEDKSDE